MSSNKPVRVRERTPHPMFLAFCTALAPVAAHAEKPSEEIVVTASPLAGDPDRFATIVTSINRSEILQHGGSTVADALKTAPGIAGSGFAAGASRPIIRGFDANRTRVLENGLGSADVSQLGPDHGVPIDPLSAEAIEVVRGAATLRYGGHAIGGVVNTIDNRVPRKLATKPFRGEVAVGYGDNAAATEGAVLIDAGVGPFAFHADAAERRASDYDTPDGAQPNSFARGSIYSGGASYFFGAQQKSRIGAALVQYDSKYGIPGGDTFIDTTQKKGMLSGALELGGMVEKITLDAGTADYEHSEMDPATGQANATFKNEEDEGRLEMVFGSLGPLKASAVGVHFFSRDFSALGEANEYLLPATQRTAAIFAFTEAPIGRLLLQAAARYEDAEMKGTPLSDIPTSTDFSLFSASLGGTFDVTDAVKLGLSASLSERPPGIEELFSRGPHEGDGTYQTGDPNLGAERAVSLEATLRVRQDRFALEGAVWRARFNDYIYGELTGRLCEDDGTCGASGDLRELFWRQRGAVFTGAEAQASYRIAKLSDGTLELRGLADTVRAKLSDGGGDVPRIPPWRIGAGLDWASAKVDACFMLLRTAEQKDVPAGESTTKGYVNLDAHLAWRPFGQGPELSLTGSNLTDSRQRSATSFNRDEVLQPGREIRLLLRTRF